MEDNNSLSFYEIEPNHHIMLKNDFLAQKFENDQKQEKKLNNQINQMQ